MSALLGLESIVFVVGFCFVFLAISSAKLNVPVSVGVCVGTGSLLSDSGWFDGNGEAFAHEILQLFFESTLE